MKEKIEIIEEDKPIEKIRDGWVKLNNEFVWLTKAEIGIANKINEIIDKLNKLEEGKK